MIEKATPLALALGKEAAKERPTPLSAFKLARRWWLDGKRINLSALAEELGVGRATIMRWVGNKDLLLGEVLWSLYKDEFDKAKARADAQPGLSGVDYLAEIYSQINQVLVQAEPLHHFLRQDPQAALKVLTSNESGIQSRLINAWVGLLREQRDAGQINPQMDIQSLAYFIVRIGEGVVYSDMICGRKPEPEPANTALRLLLSSTQPG